MQPTMRSAILSLVLLSSAILCGTHGAPIPQAETKPTSPPNRPAQAQVMLAPGQVTAAQVPQKEPVPTDARNPDRILRVGHRGSVQALAFSPDGRWLASGGYDKVIIMWNLSSGREQFRLGGQKDTIARRQQPMEQPLEKEAISALAFNPDGTRLASMHVSGVIRIWSLQTQKMLFAVNPHRIHSYGESLAYSADGKSLIIALEKRVKETTETAIGFYDADTGKSLRTVPTPWSLVSALVPTSDGRLIAAGTMGGDDDDDPSGSVQIFDGNTGSVQKTYPVVASSISADGRWMTSIEEAGPSGPHAILWSLGDGKRVHDLPLRNSGRLVFRPDGEEVAILHGDSNAIDFVSTASGQITKSLPGGGYGLGIAAYSADGKLLAAGTYAYGTIKCGTSGRCERKRLSTGRARCKA
jgi:WD40 repeat protein